MFNFSCWNYNLKLGIRIGQSLLIHTSHLNESLHFVREWLNVLNIFFLFFVFINICRTSRSVHNAFYKLYITSQDQMAIYNHKSYCNNELWGTNILCTLYCFVIESTLYVLFFFFANKYSAGINLLYYTWPVLRFVKVKKNKQKQNKTI